VSRPSRSESSSETSAWAVTNHVTAPPWVLGLRIARMKSWAQNTVSTHGHSGVATENWKFRVNAGEPATYDGYDTPGTGQITYMLRAQLFDGTIENLALSTVTVD
jgi:hypothetical protein